MTANLDDYLQPENPLEWFLRDGCPDCGDKPGRPVRRDQGATTVVCACGRFHQIPTEDVDHDPLLLLDQLCKRHGVDIVFEDLTRPGAGLLLGFTDGTFEILVRDGDPPEEQLFTIAHELGHLLLPDCTRRILLVDDEITDIEPYDSEVEARCDAYAARMLELMGVVWG